MTGHSQHFLENQNEIFGTLIGKRSAATSISAASKNLEFNKNSTIKLKKCDKKCINLQNFDTPLPNLDLNENHFNFEASSTSGYASQSQVQDPAERLHQHNLNLINKNPIPVFFKILENEPMFGLPEVGSSFVTGTASAVAGPSSSNSVLATPLPNKNSSKTQLDSTGFETPRIDTLDSKILSPILPSKIPRLNLPTRGFFSCKKVQVGTYWPVKMNCQTYVFIPEYLKFLKNSVGYFLLPLLLLDEDILDEQNFMPNEDLFFPN